MLKLNEVITGTQTVELIEPRDSTATYIPRLRLLLVDHDGPRELSITADSFLEPREGSMLIIEAHDVRPPEFSDEHGEWVDDGQSPVVDEVEPEFDYRVAIDGTETDTRLVEGGLF